MERKTIFPAIRAHDPFWDKLLSLPLAQKHLSAESLNEVKKEVLSNKAVVKDTLEFLSKKELRFLRKNRDDILHRLIMSRRLSRQEVNVLTKEFNKFLTWQDILVWADVFELIRSSFKNFRPYMLNIRHMESGTDNYPDTPPTVYDYQQYEDNKTFMYNGSNGMSFGENNLLYA